MNVLTNPYVQDHDALLPVDEWDMLVGGDGVRKPTQYRRHQYSNKCATDGPVQ